MNLKVIPHIIRKDPGKVMRYINDLNYRAEIDIELKKANSAAHTALIRAFRPSTGE